ncbi:uncharacterized protein EV422DRAFT_559774, partial [Fimicolochytrium jonesii]|uniref:uncharacterized protein n=1 Tax=Fimicolochytrium jonesii TaxID=1396493 RepID=UPI0022FE9B30
MNPEPAVALQSTAKVFEAAAYMAAKRQDAVLIVDEDSHLVGILTDKDLAYRVVAEGLDAQTTLVSQVMTANPVSVTRSTTSTDALNKMIGGQFRHLPVVESDDENSGVVGVLDITKCLYTALEKLERAYESSRKLNEAIQGVEREWSIKSGSGSIGRYAEVLRDQLACPDLAGLLATQSASPPVIGVEGTIHEAAQKMRQSRETAVLVFDADEDGMGTLAGIFTSKDLTLRVLAAGLDPSTTLVSHVMTPHPDCVTPTTPVVEALRKMHAGKYLHLPVIDENGVVEGLVDVLKLTYTTLAQMTNVQGEPGEGPVWNKFWASGTGGAEAYDPFTDQIRLRGGHSEGRTNSLVDLEHEGDQEDGDDDKYSELSSHVLRTSLPSTFNFPDDSTVAPDDSASMSPRRTLNRRSLLLHSHNNSHHLAHNTSHHHGAAPSHLTPAPTTLSTTSTPLPPHLYTFKLTHPITHQTHRFTSPFDSLPTLRQIIARKLGVSAAQLGGLSYTDDEGDHVAVVDDEGLVDAVRMAAAGGWGRLVVNVEL